MDHQQTAHVWAQNSKPEGRSSDGRMFFINGTLYSYGRHFAIGHIMADGVALLNTDGYSNSTSRHKGYARSAVSHRRSFEIPKLTSLSQYVLNTPIRHAIMDHVKENLDGYGDAAAVYMLGLAGRKDPAATLRRLRRERASAQAKADARAKASDSKRLLTIARVVATKPEERKRLIEAHANAGLSTEGGHLPALLKDVRKAMNVAKARGFKQQVNALADFAKKIMARKAKIIASASIRNKRRDLREAITKFRDLQHDHEKGLLITWRQFYRYANSAGNLMRYTRHLSGTVTASLLATKLKAEARETILRSAEDAERELQRIAEQTEKLAAWLSGETARTDLTDEHGNAYLRVKDDELQTSRGASVPLGDAVKAFRFIKLLRDPEGEKRSVWHRNGAVARVGEFQIDSINSDGSFVAGCHTIGWDEVERIARQIGVFDIEPSREIEHVRRTLTVS